ncbi:hypothetical protein V3C99_014855 [Haemonchus contortus]|uniref:WW domain-containing protein n=1 Tax=Haemonchus contortus TaxID=6289 RepID=A0A7I4YU15_HAECO
MLVQLLPKRNPCTARIATFVWVPTSRSSAKAAVTKAKNMEMDASYEKLDGQKGEKSVPGDESAAAGFSGRRGSEVDQEQRGCNPEEAWQAQAYFDRLLNKNVPWKQPPSGGDRWSYRPLAKG